MSEENSGLSCRYYKVVVLRTYDRDKDPYEAECGEIAEALDLNFYEMNIFKENWRQATARQGKKKQGNTPMRGAEKILWNAEILYQKVEHETHRTV
jgi:hypothetical protein